MNRVLSLQNLESPAFASMIAASTVSDHCDSSQSNQNCTNRDEFN